MRILHIVFLDILINCLIELKHFDIKKDLLNIINITSMFVLIILFAIYIIILIKFLNNLSLILFNKIVYRKRFATLTKY